MRRKASVPPTPTEEDEQRTLAQWLDLHGITWFHVPNQRGTRKRYEMGILWALGVKAGVPDAMILDPPPRRPEVRGVAIELKRRKGGRLSTHQQRWIQRLRELGWIAEVCEGADAAIDLLERLGYGKRRSA